MKEWLVVPRFQHDGSALVDVFYDAALVVNALPVAEAASLFALAKAMQRTATFWTEANGRN